MALIEQPELYWIFNEFGYVGPFLVLLLCGIGLPLPEEVTLFGSGILVHNGRVEFLPIVLVCAAAILLGDLIPYSLGRRYGDAALRMRWVRRTLRPERIGRLRQRFETHGNWATFICRFLPGIRIPGYFVAGTLRMKLWRFLLLDGLGVALSVPLSVYLGQLFAHKLEELEGAVEDLHQILAFLLFSVILIVVVRSWRSRAAIRARWRARQVAREALEERPDRDW